MSESSYVYRVEVDVAAVRADKHKDTEDSDLFELYRQFHDVTPPSISGENPATLCRHPIQKVTPKQIRVLRAYERVGEEQCVCSRRWNSPISSSPMRDGFGGPPLLDRKRIENQRGYYHETADLLFYLDREDAWSIVEEFAPDAPDAFDRLGLGQDATPEEVKTAYRRHSKEVHPDQGGDKKEFLELHESYEIALEFVS